MSTYRVFKLAKKVNADLYHFHDAELIPFALLFKIKGKKVVIDIHENLIEQMKTKIHLNYFVKFFSIILLKIANSIISRQFGTILAEYSYESIYKKKISNYVVILNMPKIDFFNKFIVEDRNSNNIFYIGGISNNRGLDVILEALAILKKRKIKFKMFFIGDYYNLDIKSVVPGFLKDSVFFLGRKNLSEGYEISKKCKVGLAVLKPVGNYVTSYPTKIFEYMSIKLPVITSNFTLYEEIVSNNNCGICVNPINPEEIAKSIEYIFNNTKEAKTMGENGYKKVKSLYNWENEEKKLINFYRDILEN